VFGGDGHGGNRFEQGLKDKVGGTHRMG
jgi:hypothetical protein